MCRLSGLAALACFALLACGGGGCSSGSGSNGSGAPTKTGIPNRVTPTVTPRPGGPTRTPTNTPIPGTGETLYVRTSGNDTNDGMSPQTALKTIGEAAKRLKVGTTVYVGPGTYSGRVTITGVEGTAGSPIRLVGDVTGAHTHDPPKAVEINAAEDTVAMIITKSPYVSVESFLITGAAPKATPKVSATALQIRSNSHHVTIRDCVIGNASTADGIRLGDSSDALIFDNLIFNNDRGIVVTGDSPRARIVNNTIANHVRTGISLSQSNALAPHDAMLVNNIIEGNENNLAISVDAGPPSSLFGYEGNHNLVFEPGLADQSAAYRPDTIQDRSDVNAEANFENVGQGDVRLAAGSPAIDKGTNAIGTDLMNALLKRSATVDGAADRAPLDLGYHYPR